MKIPYSLIPAVALPTRYEHMRSAIARPLPRLQPVPIDEAKTLHVACYGPSLKETWRDLRHPIISMSGATKWLAERGVIADYALDMDPRPNKVLDVTPPVPGVHYLMASVCCPEVFETLLQAGAKVTLWHTVSGSNSGDGEWLETHDPEQLLVHGGSTVGLTALHIGGLLGYRHFEIHGMDGSFADGERHAGVHTDPKKQKADITWAAGGVKYRTSKIMANAVAETINTVQMYPIFSVFHGQGLTQALVKEANLQNACCADEVEKAAFVRAGRARFVPVRQAQKTAATPWEALCFAQPDPVWLAELQMAYAIADERRHLAAFNTGSISLETGLLLRAVCEWKRPRTIVEIGTFIGRSTVALKASDRIYTCDRDNDCLPSTEQIRTFPYATSTALLQHLVKQRTSVDLFFFDGRLTDPDPSLVMRLSHSDTVYAFDDYHPGGKGWANIERLQPFLPTHGFIEPHRHFSGRSTLALLVPMSAEAKAA